MTSVLSAAFIFLAVFFALVSAYALVSDLWLFERARLAERLEREFRKRSGDPEPGVSLFKDLSRMAAELAAEGPQPGWRSRLELLLAQAGMRLTVRRFLILSAITGAVAGAAILALGLGLAVAPAVVVGAALPAGVVRHRRSARLATLQAQLPDAFETMARALRAGGTLTNALQSVSRELPLPLSGEFACCYEQQNLGLPPETAYRDLARRIGLLELNIFATTMLVQQHSGGNVAESLDQLAGMVREGLRAQLKMHTLTSEGRLQAWVLMGLPPAVFLILWVLKRPYIQGLLDHPGLLLSVAALQVVGALWIRSMVCIEE